MSWQNLVLCGYFLASIVLTPALVGKERKPIGPGEAVFVVLSLLAMLFVGYTA